MPLRLATYSDLWPAAQFTAAAFKENELYGEYLHPQRDKFPESMSYFFLRDLRLRYSSGPDAPLLVSYSVESSGEASRITGIAHWKRFRNPAPTSLYRNIIQHLVALYNSLEAFFYPDRALDHSALNAMGGMRPFVIHHWTGTRANIWNLSFLGVDPQFERRGIGRELVRWGFDRATEEGCGCSVISAEGKERFYERCGFDVVAGTCQDEGGETNPVRNINGGGTIHFWDNGIEPKGVKKYGEQ